MKCNKCDGKGWEWAMGMDTSEDCTFCKGSGELGEPTVKLVEHAAVKDYPKTNFLKSFFFKNSEERPNKK